MIGSLHLYAKVFNFSCLSCRWTTDSITVHGSLSQVLLPDAQHMYVWNFMPKMVQCEVMNRQVD